MIKTNELHISYKIYASFEDLDAVQQKIILQARNACARAYAPYSNFHVGAAFLLDDGQIIEGNNQENAAYPSGLCAERTAIFYIGANFPTQKVEIMAVTAHLASNHLDFLSISPCGACRQSVLEYEEKQKTPIKVLLSAKNGGFIELPSISSLLPFKFFEDSLMS